MIATTRRHVLLPASLRGQFALALGTLALLMLCAGAAAIATLQHAVAEMQQLAETRLASLQHGQDVLRRALLVERKTGELLNAASHEQPSAANAAVVEDLNSFDASVQQLAVSTENVSVLDLHDASQMLRSSSNIVAGLRESELRDPAASTAPAGQRAITHFRDALPRQVDALVSAAETQSAHLSQGYRAAVQGLADTTLRTQYSVLALVAAGIALAAFITHLLGRLVLNRLLLLSQRLRSGQVDATHPAQPVEGRDEISDMARAVERFLCDRHELQLRTAELIEAQQRLVHLAHHDVLTGLANRLALEDRLRIALNDARSGGHGISVAYVDVDHFKSINDRLGHAAGDRVLQEVARRLLAGVRGGDMVVRLGGDEFLIVFADQPADARSLKPRLNALLQAIAQPVLVGDRSFQVTCSMGVANFPADAIDGDALLNRADAALYGAKASGRDTFHFTTSFGDTRAGALG